MESPTSRQLELVASIFRGQYHASDCSQGETNNNCAGTTFWQLRRAAWLVWHTLEFKDKLDSQELHTDTTRTSVFPFCRSCWLILTRYVGIWFHNSTSKMFNTARIPEPFCDTLSTPPEAPTRETCPILVMLHDWCYAVPVYYPPTSPKSGPILMSPKQIEARLRFLVLDVKERLARGEKLVPVGIISGDDRDKWALVRSSNSPFPSVTSNFALTTWTTYFAYIPQTGNPTKRCSTVSWPLARPYDLLNHTTAPQTSITITQGAPPKLGSVLS